MYNICGLIIFLSAISLFFTLRSLNTTYRISPEIHFNDKLPHFHEKTVYGHDPSSIKKYVLFAGLLLLITTSVNGMFFQNMIISIILLVCLIALLVIGRYAIILNRNIQMEVSEEGISIAADGFNFESSWDYIERIYTTSTQINIVTSNDGLYYASLDFIGIDRLLTQIYLLCNEKKVKFG